MINFKCKLNVFLSFAGKNKECTGHVVCPHILAFKAKSRKHISQIFIEICNYNNIWCEGMVTLPYVPLQAPEAIDILKEKFGEFSACPITLRHMLYPGEIEPKYFVGTFMDCHTVGVYSGQVDLSFALGDTRRILALD